LVTAFINEDKNITTNEVKLHLLFYQATQPVKGFTHIGNTLVQKISPVVL
jgi:hypothetical protein